MKRLELYGDSILKGVTYSSEHKKYKLCKFAYDSLKNYGIETENHSHMGYTIDKGFKLMQSNLKECDDETLVVLEFGGNDCNYKWEDISKNPSGEFSAFTPEQKFMETYRKAIAFARQKGAYVAMVTLVPLDPAKYMRWISKGLDSEAILGWLGDENMLARWQEHYNSMVVRLAKETGCPLIDVRGDFLKTRDYGKLLSEDGIHPTQYGYDIVGANIIEFAEDYFIGYKQRRIG